MRCFAGEESADESFGQPVDSTLFRLPLRSAAQAAASELSQRQVDAAEVLALLDGLGEGLGELLLFTQHLTSIEICVLERGERRRLSAATVDVSAGDATLARRQALAAIATGEVASIATPALFELPLRVNEAKERWLVCGGSAQGEQAVGPGRFCARGGGGRGALGRQGDRGRGGQGARRPGGEEARWRGGERLQRSVAAPCS